jgi:flagellar biogenesis protein FliO
MTDTAKHVLDALSITTLVATLLSMLPAITAVLVAVWTVMRCVESWQSIKLNHRKLRGDE